MEALAATITCGEEHQANLSSSAIAVLSHDRCRSPKSPPALMRCPIWEYDAKVLTRDLGEHLVCVVSTASADRGLGGRRAG